MKKYVIVVLSLIGCFKTSFGMDDTWIQECTETHRAFRSFVETFDYESDPDKASGDIQRLEKAHKALSKDLLKTMVPLDSSISLEAKDAFFSAHKQLLCEPWLTVDEVPKILKLACSNAMKEQEDRENETWFVSDTQNSFNTLLLVMVSIAHVNPHCHNKELGVNPYNVPEFKSYEEQIRYAEKFLPMQALLLKYGACISGKYYRPDCTQGIEEGEWHCFSSINDYCPAYIELLLHHGGAGLVNKPCCPHNCAPERGHISAKYMTPLGQSFKDQHGKFSHERNIPVMRLLLERGGRLDVEGAKGAFATFVDLVTSRGDISEKDALEAYGFMKQLLEKNMVPADDVAVSRTVVFNELKSPQCRYPKIWRGMDLALMHAQERSTVQRFASAPKAVQRKKNTKNQGCNPS